MRTSSIRRARREASRYSRHATHDQNKGYRKNPLTTPTIRPAANSISTPPQGFRSSPVSFATNPSGRPQEEPGEYQDSVKVPFEVRGPLSWESRRTNLELASGRSIDSPTLVRSDRAPGGGIPGGGDAARVAPE